MHFIKREKYKVASWDGGKKLENYKKKKSACLANKEPGKETAQCTHPNNHHLHSDMLRKVDGGPEVHSQRDEEVKNGHQVLPMDSFGWKGKKERPQVRWVESREPSQVFVSRRPLGDKRASKERADKAPGDVCLLMPGFFLFFLVGLGEGGSLTTMFCFVLFCVFFFFFLVRVSLYNPGCPRTTGLKHTMIHLTQLPEC